MTRYLLLFISALAANSYAAGQVVFGIPYDGTVPVTNNALKVNSSGQISTALLAGEDQTNNVLRIEQQFSYKAGVTADAAVKSAAGFLHTVTCAGTDAAATAGDMTIRDATAAGAGTVVQTIAFAAAYFAPVTFVIDSAFSTGIYFDFTTTADVMCSASYR